MLYARQVIIDSNNKDGYIQSADYVPGKSGFIIRWNGNCEFNDGLFRGDVYANNGIFRGRIEAEDGYFRGRIEADEGVFRGTIESGPVYISNETTNPVSPQVFQANAKISDVVNALGANTNVSTGYFGSKQGLISIQASAGVVASTYVFYRLILNFNDGTSQTLQATNYAGGSINATLGSVLSIGGSVAGKIFKINNLPVGSAGLSVGTVYRDSSGYLKIVI